MLLLEFTRTLCSSRFWSVWTGERCAERGIREKCVVGLVLIAAFWCSERTLECKFPFRVSPSYLTVLPEPKHTQVAGPLQPLFAG